MTEVDDRTQKLREAARTASEGRPLVGLFQVTRPVLSSDLETPWSQRPWALSKPEVRRAPLRKIFVIGIRALSLDFSMGKIRFTSETVAARVRGELVESSKKRLTSATALTTRYFGPAGSTAAGLLVASLPRSKARVMSLLCVTADEIMLLHVPDTYRKKYFANAVDIGWRVSREQLEWTRSMEEREVVSDIQYGFRDGSWMTLSTASIDDSQKFSDAFPDTLTKHDPIPTNTNYPEPEMKD